LRGQLRWQNASPWVEVRVHGKVGYSRTAGPWRQSMAARKKVKTAGEGAASGKRAKKSGAPGKRARGKPAPGGRARGLRAAEVAMALDSPEVGEVATLVRNAGGAPIGAYREPLGGRPLMLASLPLSAVQPTPFQRDLSPTHAKRLALKIDETAAFLD